MKIFSKMKAAFSLIEVAVALGIASFGMVTLLALMPVGIQHYHHADAQSAMANLASMVVRDLQSAPSGSTSKTPQFNFKFSPTTSLQQTVYVDGSGQASGTAPNALPASTSLYRISVTIYAPPAATSAATIATILITSPALADGTPTAPPTNYSDRFETTVGLNRN
jgi:uncharacterized protein (TIGR02598 family)